MSFAGGDYTANLCAPVQIGPEEEAELEFEPETVPSLFEGEYQITVSFSGTDSAQQPFSQVLAEEGMKVVIPPETLIISASPPYENSPVILRGDCDFAHVVIMEDGQMVAEHSKGEFKSVIVEGDMVNKDKFTLETDTLTIEDTGEVHVLTYGKTIEIRAVNLIMKKGSLITADGGGYTRTRFFPQPWDDATQTPKLGGGYDSEDHGGGGAGYGGIGGNGAQASGTHGDPAAEGLGGLEYGSEARPEDFGSAGGEGRGALGGAGGGKIIIVVSDTFGFEGKISANGEPGDVTTECPVLAGAGGGSGGSIWVWATTLNGDPADPEKGEVTANGGHGDSDALDPGGGGGGGRIAIYYRRGNYEYESRIQANGGGAQEPALSGNNGSIVVKQITVSLTGPEYAIEGEDSEEFGVDVDCQPLTLTSYKWVWEPAQPGETLGHDPNVDFSDLIGQTTTIQQSHWFASPDSRLAEDVPYRAIGGPFGDEGHFYCTYLINCEVEVGGMKIRDFENLSFEVRVPVPLGRVTRPKIDGMPTVELDGDTWRVTGIGTLHRTAPVRIISVSSNGEFYIKTVAHEDVHMDQWTNQAPWMNLFDANALYNQHLSWRFSTVSEADLLGQLQARINLENTNDNDQAIETRDDRERAAYNVSNQLEPDYLEKDIP